MRRYWSYTRYFWVASLITLALSAALYVYTHWPLYIVWQLALGALTLFCYGFDKAAALRQGQRIPEIVLHLLVILGGYLGGWVGRALFRHKSRKPSFLLILMISSFLHGYLTYRFLF